MAAGEYAILSHVRELVIAVWLRAVHLGYTGVRCCMFVWSGVVDGALETVFLAS
jgi:hypothetical protein